MVIRKNSVQRLEEYKSRLCTLFHARFYRHTTLLSSLHTILVGHVPKPAGLKALQRASIGGLVSLMSSIRLSRSGELQLFIVAGEGGATLGSSPVHRVTVFSFTVSYLLEFKPKITA